MHRIFTVLDVLYEIATYEDERDLGSLVSVSRHWYTVVLPLLWRRVDFGIFKVFGRLLSSDRQYKYSVSFILVFPSCHVI